MAYPPPPYADARCGTPVAGEAICGTIWAYPVAPGLLLGGVLPTVTAVSGDIVPPAGLLLGAWVPTGAGQLGLVPEAGLLLGANAPTLSIALALSPPQAGLLLGGVAPGIGLSIILAVTPAGLLLGAVVPGQVGRVWLLPSDCADLDLVADAESDLVLVGAGSTDLVLDPEECL